MARRPRNYAAEYRARSERERALGLPGYSQARRLRALFPLSDMAKAQTVATYGRKSLTEMHTKYAITRAHIARAQEHRGERLTPKKRTAIRQIATLPDMTNPVLALGNFYQSIRMDPGRLPTSREPLREPRRPSGFGGGGGFEPRDIASPSAEPGGFDESDVESYREGGESGLTPRELETEARDIGRYWQDFEEDTYDWYDDLVEDFEQYDYGEYGG